MPTITLVSESLDIRRGVGVLHGIPLSDKTSAVNVICEDSEIDVAGSGLSPGLYELWLADLDVVERSSHRTTRNVSMLYPLVLDLRDTPGKRLEARLDERQIFRISTLLGREPRENYRVFLSSADRTIEVTSDKRGQVYVLGNPTGHLMQFDSEISLLIENMTHR